MPNIVRNLYPKFNNTSVIPTKIKDVISVILESPIKIPNYLGENNSKINKQISSYNNNKDIALYQYVDKVNLDNYYEKYSSNKKKWEATPFSQKKKCF